MAGIPVQDELTPMGNYYLIRARNVDVEGVRLDKVINQVKSSIEAIKTDFYTKAESDSRYASKTDVYTKSEVDTALNGKVSAQSGYGLISDADKAQIQTNKAGIAAAETAIAGKAGQSEVDSIKADVAGKASQTEVETIKTDVAGKASAESVAQLQTDMSVQTARMDQLVGTVPEGSADEIADARVMADGKTSQNLGDAIRTQVTSLKETITQLNGLGKDLVLESGSITTSQGNNVNATNRARTANYSRIDQYNVFINKNGYDVCVYFYGSEKNYLGNTYTKSGWINKQAFTIRSTDFSDAVYFRVVFRNHEDTDVDPAAVGAKFVESTTFLNEVLGVEESKVLNLEHGGIYLESGEIANKDKNRLHTDILLVKSIININLNTAYEYYLYFYDADFGYHKAEKNWWRSGRILLEDYEYVRIVIKKKDNTDIDLSENIFANVSYTKEKMTYMNYNIHKVIESTSNFELFDQFSGLGKGLQIESGGIEVETGNNFPAENRARTVSYNRISQYNVIVNKSRNDFCVYYYDSSKTYLGCTYDVTESWINNVIYTIQSTDFSNAKYFRIVFRNSDNKEIDYQSVDVTFVESTSFIDSLFDVAESNELNLEHGGVSTISGEVVNNDKNRLHTDILRVDSIININMKSGYQYYAYYYDDDFNYHSPTATYWRDGRVSLGVYKYVRLVIRKSDDSELETDTNVFSNVSYTKENLTSLEHSVSKFKRKANNYVVGADLLRRNVSVEFFGKPTYHQAFVMYDGKIYSTDGEHISVQDSNFNEINNVEMHLGHGNAFHRGSGNLAYVSGWEDNKIYVVNLDTVAVVDTITLPSSINGITSCAVDDFNKLVYVFNYAAGAPSVNVNYNFIVYDYENDEIISQKVIREMFSSIQGVDFYEDKIILLNGGGSLTQPNGYRVFDTNGNILANYHIGDYANREPEGVYVDRNTQELYFSYWQDAIYKITAI